MLTRKQIEQVRRLEASLGYTDLPIPRDRLPQSYYAQRRLDENRMRARQELERAYIPGHTRDAATGKFISKEAYVNSTCNARIDGREPSYREYFSFTSRRTEELFRETR